MTTEIAPALRGPSAADLIDAIAELNRQLRERMQTLSAEEIMAALTSLRSVGNQYKFFGNLKYLGVARSGYLIYEMDVINCGERMRINVAAFVKDDRLSAVRWT